MFNSLDTRLIKNSTTHLALRIAYASSISFTMLT
jgi:hypothetical protein